MTDPKTQTTKMSREQMIEWLKKQTGFEKNFHLWPKEELAKFEDIVMFILSTGSIHDRI